MARVGRSLEPLRAWCDARLRGGKGMGRHSGARRWGRIARVGAVALGCLALAHCSGPLTSKESKYSKRVVEDGEPVPKGGGTYRVGRPYNINGRTYVPHENPNYRAEGVASWYGPDFHGRLTANGEVYDMHGISAAHTDHAAAELCPRHQSGERPLDHRARQRSRSLCPRARHRPLRSARPRR